MNERWRPVPDFEGYYEVSSLGRVQNIRTGHVLKGKVNRGGYLQVNLAVNGKVATKTIHRLVAGAHIPNPHGYPLVLHGPRGKRDNSVQNLRWGTNSDNMYDKRRDGTDHEVNKTHCPQGHEYTPENTQLDQGKRKCRTCVRTRTQRRWETRTGVELPASDPRHGTTYAYNWFGCRCSPCKGANREYSRKYREKQRRIKEEQNEQA